MFDARIYSLALFLAPENGTSPLSQPRQRADETQLKVAERKRHLAEGERTSDVKDAYLGSEADWLFSRRLF